MYWAEWSKLRDMLQAKGKSLGQCDDYRHALTRRAIGMDKSSTKFTNVELDRVLARIRAEREPSNLDAQIALQESPEKRRAFLLERCDWCCSVMWSRGNDSRMLKPEARQGYIAGTARNLIKKEIAECSAEEIAKVLGVLEARRVRLETKAAGPVRATVQAEDDGNPF